MAEFDYDLFVIGAGSGGVRAARVAAKLGARVGLTEDSDLGGTCVNRGCVPKKLLVYAGRFRYDLEDMRGFGWTVPGEPTFDWAALIAAKDREIGRLNDVYGDLLDGSGVDLVRGRARFVDPNAIEVDGRRITAEKFLVTTGGTPHVVDIPGKELAITSDEVFHLDAMPERVVIAGGGYIGLEMGSIFRSMGAEVHVVHRGAHVLSAFDHECTDFLLSQLRLQGMHVHMEHTIEKLAKTPTGIAATLDDGTVLEGDVQLAATGRKPNTAGLGLDTIGVDLAPSGAVLVDDEFRTNVPSVFALGDVIERMPLTPVAIAEAMAFVSTQFGGKRIDVDYMNVPTAIFTSPEMASVGISEEHAWERGHRVHCFCSQFRPMRNTLAQRNIRSLMKMVVDEETDRVLGVHVVGPDAGEIVQGFAVAVRAGVTKSDLDTTIGIHPTAAEELVQMREPVKRAAGAGNEIEMEERPEGAAST